jgi:O-antigen/teichoic acid export membrane protein
LKKSVIYNFLLTGSNLLFPLLTFPYLSRVLGAEGLGVCNFIISYGQNFIIIAALGLPVYGVREIAKIGDDKLKRSKLFFELLTINLLFTIVLLAIYIATVFMYSDLRDYKDIALLGGSLILFNVFSIQWLFAGINDFKYITIRSLIVRALSVICIFLLVKKKDDFTIYFLILVFTAFLTSLIDVNYAKKFITRKIKLSFKDIAKQTRPMVILGIYIILTSIYSVLPTTLLGFLSTKSAVGYYYSANKIITMVLAIFGALMTVMTPHLNNILEEKGKEEYMRLVYKAFDVVASFGVPIAFLVYLLADPIVMLLAGKNFVSSIFVLQVMAPKILFVSFAQVFVYLILSVYRKDNIMVFLSVTGMIISLLINIIFIPHFAEKATAFSQLIAEFVVTILAFISAKKVLKFNFPYKRILLNLLFAIPFILINYITLKFTENSFLIISIAGSICVLYFLFYQLVILKNIFIKNLLYDYLFKYLKKTKT